MTKKARKSGSLKTSKNTKSTFTYYIPAPPLRKTGYREREFDKILTGILQSGFEIESLMTQAVGGSENGGLYVIAVLNASTRKISDLDRGQEIQERFKLTHTHSSPDIILDEDDELV